jgi:hypothetical protein
MKYCAFDIEIAKELPEGETDWKAHRPLGISCAATMLSGADKPLTWYSSQDDIPTYAMSQASCERLVLYLSACLRDGYIPLTWNGCGFDFDILAEESGMVEECKHLALNHVDMMFHFFCVKGFAIGLDAACKGMGLPGKPEGMHGALAPEMWAEGRFEEVLDYVGSDVENTLRLTEAVEMERGWISWETKRGKIADAHLGSWLTTKEATVLPPPDTSWMDNPWPRSKFTGWIDAEPTDAERWRRAALYFWNTRS